MTADVVLDPPAEARLRAALDAAATTDPVDPAWEAIRARLDDDLDDLDDLDGPVVPSLSGRRRVLLAAAVALAALAVGAAVVAATRPDGSTVVTDTTTPPLPPATGWYVPVDLPEGWSVDDVTATRYPTSANRCDGPEPFETVEGATWIAPARRARLTLRSDTCPTTAADLAEEEEQIPDELGMATETFDLGQGVAGRMMATDNGDDPEHFVDWVVGDRLWTLRGTGVSTDELLAAARSAVADGPFPPAPPGFQEADRWTAPTTPSIDVAVTVTAPSGTRMHYRLEEPGRGIGHGTLAPEPLDVPGQDLTVWEMWDGEDGGFWAMQLAGFWPGADMAVMLLYRSGEPGPPAEGSAEAEAVDGEVRELVGHLRPATTETWRAFLDGVEHTPVLAEAATFADLATLDVPDLEPPPDEPPPTTER